MANKTLTSIAAEKAPSKFISQLKRDSGLLAALIVFILFPFVFAWVTGGFSAGGSF